jgi:hypothetical protein
LDRSEKDYFTDIILIPVVGFDLLGDKLVEMELNLWKPHQVIQRKQHPKDLKLFD